MKVIEFYRKGAQVVVEGSGTDMSSTFSAAPTGDVQIGYVPATKAKPVEGPAHDVISHNGNRYLLLRGGYVYEIKLLVGDVVKEDVVSAEHGHLILPLPAGATVSAVDAAE